MLLSYFFFIIIIYFLNEFLIKKNLLSGFTGESHQKFSITKHPQVTGGIFLILGYVILNYKLLNYYYLSFFIIFFIGILSDTNKLSSAKTRFFLQIITITFFVFIADIQIDSVKIIPLDQLLQNNIFNYIFVSFCILIIINGSNFIDGLNTLTIGYYFLVASALIKISLLNQIDIPLLEIFNVLLILLAIYLLNFLNKLFLGDNGSYLLGLYFSFLLIKINGININISPYFIVLLLWYPGFEIFFSIVRKYNFKKSPLSPDKEHFHQMFFYFLMKKFNLKKIKANLWASSIINIYNGIIFLIGSTFVFHSQGQIILIMFNIFLYCFLYIRLKKFKIYYR